MGSQAGRQRGRDLGKHKETPAGRQSEGMAFRDEEKQGGRH